MDIQSLSLLILSKRHAAIRHQSTGVCILSFKAKGRFCEFHTPEFSQNDRITIPVVFQEPFTLSAGMTQPGVSSNAQAAIQYAQCAEKLSLETFKANNEPHGGTAVEAKFITPLDPVIQTADGNRLPAVPVTEAHRFNVLKSQVDQQSTKQTPAPDKADQSLFSPTAGARDNNKTDLQANAEPDRSNAEQEDGDLRSSVVPTSTHPLFPPLPLYGPPSWMRRLQCTAFRCTSFILSNAFLAVIVLGSAFTSLPLMFRHIGLRIRFQNPDARRPFHQEEVRRRKKRKQAEREWVRQRRHRGSRSDAAGDVDSRARMQAEGDYEPTEGGPDPLVCDPAYYARRVGLDMEEYKVQTEDGFIITLWHLYNPKEYEPAPPEQRKPDAPEVFINGIDRLHSTVSRQYVDGQRRYPVLLIPGLLQSAGAYCTNDDDSLAFYLQKSGYDVWLGSNRCGFNPEHSLLQYSDPRMWAWNIRQMGVMDLPALISRVLEETGFEKLGLVCHSQGTTETFVALAKEQRPDLGKRISVFCALAPAVYAGPLIGKMYFKFMRIISPAMFRIFFGVHAFIPFMMTMHAWLPARLYGAMGYRVFSFLFNWTDDRWERDLRDRMFQFAPVYVSAESMRWWLGRECFAKHKCILATREQGRAEDVEDEEAELRREAREEAEEEQQSLGSTVSATERRGRKAWYNEDAPPMAMWIGGSDELVDGRRLLRRFERGRESHVKIVHAKIIEEYEHLDVLWAMDSIEQVAREVKEVIWKTMGSREREICRAPNGVREEEERDQHEGGRREQPPQAG